MARIEKAATFNQGFDTVEFLSSALVDMKMHLAGSTAHRSRRLREGDAHRSRHALGDRHAPPADAVRPHLLRATATRPAYYSYLWADTLTADAFEAFVEGGGAYDKAVAGRFVKYVLSAGNTVDPAEGYRAFRGRDAGIDALMRDRGFPVPAKK